jgi:hypothetical protein
MQRTHWASLWAKAIRENRRLRRWLVVGILVAAFLSAGLTFGLVRHLFVPPQMTPLAAIGIFRYHSQVPPEWTFKPLLRFGCRLHGGESESEASQVDNAQKPKRLGKGGDL